MVFILYGLGYVLLLAITLGVMAIIGWWIRWMIAVIYLLGPALMVFWFIWAFFVAIPMGLLFDGSPAEKKVVEISHMFNDWTGNVLLFCFTLPFKVFIWADQIVTYILN